MQKTVQEALQMAFDKAAQPMQQKANGQGEPQLPVFRAPIAGERLYRTPSIPCVLDHYGERFIHDPERPDRTASFFGVAYNWPAVRS